MKIAVTAEKRKDSVLADARIVEGKMLNDNPSKQNIKAWIDSLK